MAEGKLIDVAVQVLGAHEVVDAVIATLKQRPEAFDAVSMGLLTDIFANAVAHDMVIKALQVEIGAMAISIDRLAGGDGSANDRLKGSAVIAGDSTGNYLAAALEHPENCRLSGGAAPHVLALGGVLILLLTANVGFINFHRLATHWLIGLPGKPRLADALGQKPCAFLRHAQITCHLSRGDALAGRGHHVDGHEPLMQGKLGLSQNRAGADAEMLAAVPAAVGHRDMVDAFGYVQAAAMGAGNTRRPTLVFEEFASGIFVRKLLKELVKAECLAHVYFTSQFRVASKAIFG